LCPAFQGHSRSSERTRIDEFLLVVHNNGPISYRFRNKRRFLTRYAKNLYLPPCTYLPHSGVTSWNFAKRVGFKNQNDGSITWQKVIKNSCNRIDTIPELDRQTDRYDISLSRSACYSACWRAINYCRFFSARMCSEKGPPICSFILIVY